MSKSLEVAYDPIIANIGLLDKLMSPLAEVSDLYQFFDLDPKDLNPILEKYAVDLLKKVTDFINWIE